MSAVRREYEELDVREVHRSGEHSIELDRLVRRAFEDAFDADLQATSQLSRFELEEVLAQPEAKPTEPPPTPVVNMHLAETPIQGMPIVSVGAEVEGAGIAIDSLPPPAIEVDRTKEEERDP